MDIHVMRGWFVSIVGGTCALVGGCSSVNPDYVDTASQGQASGSGDGGESRPKGTSTRTDPGDTGDSVDEGHDDDTDGDGDTRGDDEDSEDGMNDSLDTADGDPPSLCDDGGVLVDEIEASADTFVVRGDCEDSALDCRSLNYGTTPAHEIADPTPVKPQGARSYLVARFPITSEIADLSQVVFTEFLVRVSPDWQAGERLQMVAYAVDNTIWVEGEQNASTAQFGESSWDRSSAPSTWAEAEDPSDFPATLATMLGTASIDDVRDNVAVLKAADPDAFLLELSGDASAGGVYLNVAFTAINGRVTVQTLNGGHPPRLKVTWCERD